MKSSMAFIQSNGWTEIDLIFKKKYGGGLYDDRSALSSYVVTYYKVTLSHIFFF